MSTSPTPTPAAKAPSVKEFAGALAGQLAVQYPPQLESDPARKPSVSRITRLINDVCDKAAAYKAEQKLGWLGKARMGNEFRWALTELGYSKEFVEFATEAVVVHLSRPAPGRSK